MEEVKKLEADNEAYANVDTGAGKTGLMISLFVGLVGGVGIGLYLYNKKTKEIEEGGNDDKYTKFIDDELNN